MSPEKFNEKMLEASAASQRSLASYLKEIFMKCPIFYVKKNDENSYIFIWKLSNKWLHLEVDKHFSSCYTGNHGGEHEVTELSGYVTRNVFTHDSNGVIYDLPSSFNQSFMYIGLNTALGKLLNQHCQKVDEQGEGEVGDQFWFEQLAYTMLG